MVSRTHFVVWFVGLFCIFSLFAAHPIHAAGNLSQYLCDVDFVADKVGKPNWIILDGRGGSDYEKGHIPGAVNYGKAVVTVLKHPIDGRVVPIEEAEKLLSAIGLTNDKGLIVYGKKGDYHVLCEFYPVFLGVKDFVYLDGGYEAWVAAGEKVEKGKISPVPGNFKSTVARPEMYVSTEEMMRIVKEKSPKVTLIDVRSLSEFTAEENTLVRAGRIPGAINISVDKNLDYNTGRMLPKRFLAEVYKDVPKENRVILYCHRGCRTGYGFIALEMLGYKNVSIYEDSMVVWGSMPNTPIEHEHYINLRAYNGRIGALEGRIKQLEKELEGLKNKK